MNSDTFSKPFAKFIPNIIEQSILRKKITAAYRKPEKECLISLLEQGTFDITTKNCIAETTKKLINQIRSKNNRIGIEGLIQEYSLSSEEGIALMCLAEALLRIPDRDTRNDLIRDKISKGNWKSHIGRGRSFFVNTATLGLIITKKLLSSSNSNNFFSLISNLIYRCGRPIARKGIDISMRLIGERFVRGETIEEALKKSKSFEKRGFRYSYDMLGEAATTLADAERYYRDYETAIHAIGKASNGRGIYKGPGISIKLSALHPRYSRSQSDRIMQELVPRVKELSLLSKNYNIGLNIDAEESNRIELSLDILENLCFDKKLSKWDGIGFVVQAYGRRCPYIIDYLVDLAKRSKHRLMVRLVKGAYWDSEIKKAQVEGLESYPVYTRKVYTDVSYIACAKKLLNYPNEIFPQFATHNAQTLSTIYHISGSEYHLEKFEFQCLHGMGEPLYNEVVGKNKLNRPTRIYAPVGTHETLLAYLVRRLLENGANSSFVHRIADKSISVEEMISDPVDIVKSMKNIGESHNAILSPKEIFYPDRINSKGYDLSNEIVLLKLTKQLQEFASKFWNVNPFGHQDKKNIKSICNPGDHRDVIGNVFEATKNDVNHCIKNAKRNNQKWSSTSIDKRSKILEKAADIMENKIPVLLSLISRESGKSITNSISEVREAIDFLRFYACQARKILQENNKPLGTIVCISPWNFPLSIFIGQISAALVTGNSVLAKPSEETPLIAFEAVCILYEAGIPKDVLYFIPGNETIGSTLVESEEISAVMFTGSTDVARIIQEKLSHRLNKEEQPIPLIAETGGQNAMIVDSSALIEQVVSDVISSSFDSAGQRCSSLRVLFLQDDIADRTLEMIKGAMHELRLGRTDFIGIDVGPVINTEAQDRINCHIAMMRKIGYKIDQVALPPETNYGTFVPPSIIEIDNIKTLKKEIFGPVLHVIRYFKKNIDNVIKEINNTGYGLTFGLHTRINETINYVISNIHSGNIYVNRNIIGAVVGSQPFGGRGLSGTGPKAGGFFYLQRLVNPTPKLNLFFEKNNNSNLEDFLSCIKKSGFQFNFSKNLCKFYQPNLNIKIDLPGPVGEENYYMICPKGKILLIPETLEGLCYQIIACLKTNNSMIIDSKNNFQKNFKNFSESITKYMTWTKNWNLDGPFSCALIEGDKNRVRTIQKKVFQIPGPLISIQSSTLEKMRNNEESFCLDWMLNEVSVSINTTAAGGNARLMTIE